MIKNPKISPSHLFSLLSFTRSHLLEMPIASSNPWVNIVEDCLIKNELFFKNSFFIRPHHFKKSLQKIPHDEINKTDEVQWVSISQNKKLSYQKPLKRIIIEWGNDSLFWDSILDYKKNDCEVWLRGELDLNFENWNPIWIQCNDIGVSWIYSHFQNDDKNWEVILSTGFESDYSFQKIWPLNDWIIRFWEGKFNIPLSPILSPFPWKYNKKWNEIERKFQEAYVKRWGEESLNLMISAVIYSK